MYQALYRKYRPKTFEDLVGQEHITRVLENQVETNSISHAYLFSGTRGTGKTSAAKIFARAVNCLSENLKKPCNICENCLESLEESTIDIIEIDAASNNGVDNIRDLKDRAFYQPASLKYKVYIIDEVHMLSKGAFNALLKILEEPPEHLIFILATTEPERIPLTILSRVQKFQFNRIDPSLIEASLKKISSLEGKHLEDKVIKVLVSRSDGSMRDALSILDQLLTSGNREIDYELAISILGIVSSDVLFNLVDQLIDPMGGAWIESLDRVLSSGKDIEELNKDILEHFRRLMISKVAQSSLDRYILTDKDRYLEQAAKLDLESIMSIMKILLDYLNQSRYSQQKRALLEISMIEIINEISKDRKCLEVFEEKNPGTIKNKVKKTNLEGSINEEIINDKSNIPKSKDDLISSQDKVKEFTQGEEINEIINEDDSNDNVDLDRIKSDWKKILAELRKTNKPYVHAFIIESSLESYKDGVLTVGFPPSYDFHLKQLTKKENIEIVEKILTLFYNINIKLNAIFIDNIDQDLNEDLETLEGMVGKDNLVIL